MINICVVSSDPALSDACRLILDELVPENFEIYPDARAGAHAYIWDAESGSAMPDAMQTAKGAVKVVVLSKRSRATTHSNLSPKEFSFLQSPWTMLSLQVLLASIASRVELIRTDSGSASLRFDRDRILQKLLESNARLQESEQNRTNFLMRAIHDIRIPLMAVHGYCGLLLEGHLGSVTSEQSQILERMKRSLARLSSLADSLMGFGRGTRFSTKVELRPSSVEASFNQALHEILPFVEQKGIRLNLDFEPPTGTILFDPGQIEQVLVNLLDNACKFTPKRGAINVRGYTTGPDENRSSAGYRIDISDTGPGIATELAGQIFNEYASYKGSADRSGVGLGLAICRMIVDAHQGRIWASSNDGGATFSLVLPYSISQVESSNGQISMDEHVARAV